MQARLPRYMQLSDSARVPCRLPLYSDFHFDRVRLTPRRDPFFSNSEGIDPVFQIPFFRADHLNFRFALLTVILEGRRAANESTTYSRISYS